MVELYFFSYLQQSIPHQSREFIVEFWYYRWNLFLGREVEGWGLEVEHLSFVVWRGAIQIGPAGAPAKQGIYTKAPNQIYRYQRRQPVIAFF